MRLLLAAGSVFTLLSVLGYYGLTRVTRQDQSAPHAVLLTVDARGVEPFDWSLPVQFTVTRSDGRRVLEVALGYAYAPKHNLRPGNYVFALYGEGCPTRVVLQPTSRVSVLVTLHGRGCEMAVRRTA